MCLIMTAMLLHLIEVVEGLLLVLGDSLAKLKTACQCEGGQSHSLSLQCREILNLISYLTHSVKRVITFQ